jgi:hypothetical protein
MRDWDSDLLLKAAAKQQLRKKNPPAGVNTTPNTTRMFLGAQDENCFVLNRQKEANKGAMFFVSNRKPFWEAGILPLNYSRSASSFAV